MTAGGRFKLRVRFIALGFLAIAFIIVGRLYFLQIVHGSDYALRADRQFVSPGNSLYDRGSIYFTAKDGTPIAAATLKTGVSLALRPREISDAAALFQQVSELLPVDRELFMARATRQGTQYVVLEDRLPAATGKAVQERKLQGIEVVQDRWRWYPGKALAAQELGFVAYNGDKLEGRYGLERYYEPVLERAGSDLYMNFFVELFSNVKSVLGGTERGDVITSIEPSVQAELERHLAQYQSEWNPQLSGGIIMDPKTGAIYAMALAPSFDLNSFSKEENAHVFGNPLVEGVYEMGSIIKPLTMAAGIDAGVVTPSTLYNDAGCITVNTAKICNYDGKARGTIPMQEVLNQSLNLGVSFVATQMGRDRMREYFLDRYKLGQETGVDLPSEGSGLMNNLDSPRQVEFNTAAFGQGIALTPIETVRALATLANGGLLVTPHLATAIRTESGITRTLGWGEPQLVLKKETSETISRMLATVVDTSLIGGKYKLDRWSVAAKTGTAQIADPSGGGYYDDRYLHSFFGYLPAYDARFIIFLYAYEPVGAKYASQTWATHFHELTKFLINYYEIPPDR